MRIQNFIPVKYNKSPQNSLPAEEKYTKSNPKNENFKNFPNFSYAQAFLGGASLDLRKTFDSLEESQYPEGIYEAAKETLENRNPDAKTLYDVHFEKYKGIVDCYSLDELKAKYPEFQDVVSVYNVNAKEKSFIGEFLAGESEIFAADEDLTLQLIKLYWGQGFSLNDLSNYIAENSSEKTSDEKGLSLYHTMKKLNIPRMNPHYAHVLKFSNKQYNEKFTSEMSIKLKENREAKQQLKEGEPVVIPRGPLSEAHKQHISEGLKKYYLLNPDSVYNLSKRQKDFYTQNPELKEQLSIAMTYAWNKTQEGMSVKKYLAKFMKKFGGFTEEELSLSKELNEEKKSALNMFWSKNGWAKDKFSIAAKKGWDYAKNFPPLLFAVSKNTKDNICLHVTPSQLNKKIINRAKAKGYNVNEIDYFGAIMLNKTFNINENAFMEEHSKKLNKIQSEYEKEFPKDSDLTASSLQLCLIDFKNDLEQFTMRPDMHHFKPDSVMLLDCYLEDLFKEKPLYDNLPMGKIPTREMSTIELVYYYQKLAAMLSSLDDGYRIAEYLNKKLDKIYDLLVSGNQGAINKIFQG